uniref:RNase H type-1 domain-containing protein n=1 Tax=Opuntia streptacantha TaxID=393608 RepID=A0A7C9A6W4_OPUST
MNLGREREGDRGPRLKEKRRSLKLASHVMKKAVIPVPQFIRWNPPTPGTVKLNFDGSLQGRSAAGGYILRDWKGEPLMVGASNYGNTSIIIAESRALRDGLQAALQLGLHQLDIEGDNAVVIGALRREIDVPWQIRTVIEDLQSMLQQIAHSQVMHIYREANMAADWLSKFGHSISDTWSATQCNSIDFVTIIQDDRIGRTLVRRGS